MNIKSTKEYTTQFKRYKDLKQATYFAMMEIEKLMFEHKNTKFTDQETLQQIENLLSGFKIFDTERHIWFLEEANKAISKEDKITKISNKEYQRCIKSLREKYCHICENDNPGLCDCIVTDTESLLWEHVKEECKEQLEICPINYSCDGCIHEHDCSLPERENYIFI